MTHCIFIRSAISSWTIICIPSSTLLQSANTLSIGRAGFANVLMECASQSELCESMVNIVAMREVLNSGRKDLWTCQN
jgi:hypothetical protein